MDLIRQRKESHLLHLTFQRGEIFLLSSSSAGAFESSSAKVTTIARNFFLFERICSFGTRASSRSDYEGGGGGKREREGVSPKHTLNLSFCVWQQGLMRQREWFSGSWREGGGGTTLERGQSASNSCYIPKGRRGGGGRRRRRRLSQLACSGAVKCTKQEEPYLARV